MIKFGPNRYNPEDNSYDAPIERMTGPRFTMPQIKDVQSETTKPVYQALDVSKQQKHVDGLVHNMGNFIMLIEQKGDRGQAERLAKRVQELKSLPIDDDIVKAFESLHRYTELCAREFDE